MGPTERLCVWLSPINPFPQCLVVFVTFLFEWPIPLEEILFAIRMPIELRE